MSKNSPAHQLTLWLAQKGGKPSGSEPSLIERVRDRLNKRVLPAEHSGADHRASLRALADRTVVPGMHP